MHMHRLLLSGALLLGCSAPAFADLVHLNDGKTLEGSLKKTDDGYDVTLADGTVKKVPAGEVKSVELKTSGAPDELQKRFDSLKRSTDNVNDPKVAVGRYKDFIAKNPGARQVQDAKGELEIWQDRIDEKMTKAGDRWVTPAELGRIQEESLVQAIAARTLLRQGRMKEAGPILDQAIKDDPTNASAHYLRGVMYYRQEQLGPAKKAFETTASLVQDHGATQNNLAVVLWRQGYRTAAVNAYDAALVAAPGEPIILNNVAEALNALPKSERDGAAVKKLVRRFTEQDEVLAEAMAKEGRYRWGAVWVTSKELDQLEAKENEIKDKLQVLDDQFRAAKSRLDQIDAEIADTQRTLRRLEADSYSVDATGRPVRRGYPAVYYQLRRDLLDLQREYEDQETEIGRLRGQAKKVQQEMPTPRYTGIQRLIEVEGTPLLPRNDPADAAAGGANNGNPLHAPDVKPAPPPRRDPDAVPPVPPPPPLEPGPPFKPQEARIPSQS